MAKFNTKKESLIPRVPSEVNEMGERAYRLSPEEELVSTVLTTFVQKSYYESENEILNRIKTAMSKCSTEFIAKLAIYTRREANMRSSSHVLAAEVAERVSGTEWGTRFYNRVVVRPDDMSEILGYRINVMKKNLTNAMRKGFRKSLNNFDAYQVDKYKMKRRDVSLVDLVRLCRPNRDEKFRRLLAGESLADLYSTKILEKERSAAGKDNSNISTTDALRSTISENGVNTPIMNLLRNLTKIIKETPDQLQTVVDVFNNREKVVNSRLLPFRFAMAYEEVSKLKSSGKAISFSGSSDVSVNMVLEALEAAMKFSCENIPLLPGNTAILIDNSGSMRGDIGGPSKVSLLSKVTTNNIAHVFGAMMATSQPSIYVGLFGDKLIQFKPRPEEGVLEMASRMGREGANCGGATEHGIYTFFDTAIKSSEPIHNVIVFSDMVIGSGCRWYGKTHVERNFQSLFKEFKKAHPGANVISVDLRQTSGTTVFDKSLGVHQTAGWSNKIFDTIGSISKGYKEILEQINSIEL